jgi:multidrug efflux pump subunit AcrA (membrane-fusion protein)
MFMKLLTWIRNLKWFYKLGIVAIIVLALYFGYNKFFATTGTVNYQTAKVTKGTLVTSIAATGSITAGNTTNISTKASGTVSKVYVENGDTVKKGQKILDITLDSDGIERRSTAWQAYLKSKEEVVSATKDKQDLSIQIWKDRQAILDMEEVVSHIENLTGLTDDEKNQKLEAVNQAKLAFDVTAAKFDNADSVIAAAKISQSAAYLDYQDVSGSIVAPAAGIINNLTLTAGSTLTASTSQSTTTGSTYASSQNIGFIRSANNQYQAKVSLTEVDAPKVEAGQKVNIVMDAHSDKAFTGTVLAVDVSGTSTSGVSSYPATILMDATELPVYPNMSVSATIITDIEADVLLVPSTAITTGSGESSVQLMKEGKPVSVSVEIGKSNDTQTVVVSGLVEGDTIVTGSSTSVKNNNTSSAFSSNRSSGTGERSAVFVGGPGL